MNRIELALPKKTTGSQFKYKFRIIFKIMIPYE